MRSVHFEPEEILETVKMVQMENLDIRTITMGISLRDCAHPELAQSARRAYDKICRHAEQLVRVGDELEREYGIPIINRRIPSRRLRSWPRAPPPMTMSPWRRRLTGRQSRWV